MFVGLCHCGCCCPAVLIAIDAWSVEDYYEVTIDGSTFGPFDRSNGRLACSECMHFSCQNRIVGLWSWLGSMRDGVGRHVGVIVFVSGMDVWSPSVSQCGAPNNPPGKPANYGREYYRSISLQIAHDADTVRETMLDFRVVSHRALFLAPLVAWPVLSTDR